MTVRAERRDRSRCAATSAAMRRSSRWSSARSATSLVEGLLGRDRDPLALELELTGVDPARAVTEHDPDGPRQERAQLRVGERRELPDRAHARRGESLLGARADAGERAHRQRGEEARLPPRWDDGDPAGLPSLRGDLADDLRGRHAQRARERRRCADGDLDRLCDRARPPERADDAAEVEVALVQPRPLHAGHHLTDRRPHRLRVLSVERVARADEDDVGAAAQRLGRAHRRADAVPARDVVRGRDHAAALRIASDDQGAGTERRVLELLDRGEERVQVEVSEDPHGGRLRFLRDSRRCAAAASRRRPADAP